MLVDDFAAAFGFYRDTLGSPSPPATSRAATRRSTPALASSRSSSAAARREVVELRPPGDSTLLVLEVDDVDAAIAGKDEHLARAPVDKPDWGGRVAYLRDPSGNLIELFQTLPRQE